MIGTFEKLFFDFADHRKHVRLAIVITIDSLAQIDFVL